MPHGSIQLEVVSLGAQLRAEADDLLSAAELAYCLGFLRAEEHMGARVAAKRAVSRLLGGDLNVRSQPGAGATFTLWLPLRRPAAAHQRPAA